MNMLLLLDYTGVAVFAATGALAASRKQLDIIGFLFLAAITGIGGGTLRDIILGTTPVFWVENSAYITITAIVAAVVFLGAHLVESRYRLLLWFDAIGLSVFSVMGAAKGLEATGSTSVSIITGMLTATFGGVLRDLLSGEPSVLMRREIYVSAAMAGAAIFTGLSTFGATPAIAALSGFAVALGVRGGALYFGWNFPPYKTRPGRDPDDLI